MICSSARIDASAALPDTARPHENNGKKLYSLSTSENLNNMISNNAAKTKCPAVAIDTRFCYDSRRSKQKSQLPTSHFPDTFTVLDIIVVYVTLLTLEYHRNCISSLFCNHKHHTKQIHWGRSCLFRC